MNAERDSARELLHLATQIADGTDIDWDEATSTAKTSDGQTVALLRDVAQIAAAHRHSFREEVTPDRAPTEPASVPTGSDSGAHQGDGFRKTHARWGHLELMHKIADSPRAEIYIARDPTLDREVALKLLRRRESEDPCVMAEMIHEGRLLARVEHPNVARVYGANCHGDLVGIWMELIRGHTLEDLLARQGCFGQAETAAIGGDLCRALAAVHHQGVLHRDIKTKNIMREEGGRYILIDFGIGRDTRREDESLHEAAGTPLYMAPELFRNEPATVQSDIYSLGVALFRLLTAAYPVEGRSWLDVKEAHGKNQRNYLGNARPDLSESFRQAIEKAIDPEPAKRYASAGEFERALVAVPALPRWRRLRIPAAAAAAVIALLWIAAHFGRGYDVEARLNLMANGTATPLEAGSTISLGDRLTLDFEGSRQLYVYVLSQDDMDQGYLLFPMDGSDVSNPLPGGQKHRLPGTADGMQLLWTVTSTAGREHVVIVASPTRLTEFEQEIRPLNRPGDTSGGEAAYPRVQTEALSVLRGLGGVDKEPPAPDRNPAIGGDIMEAVEKLKSRRESVRGVWVRQIDLDYDGP